MLMVDIPWMDEADGLLHGRFVRQIYPVMANMSETPVSVIVTRIPLRFFSGDGSHRLRPPCNPRQRSRNRTYSVERTGAN